MSIFLNHYFEISEELSEIFASKIYYDPMILFPLIAFTVNENTKINISKHVLNLHDFGFEDDAQFSFSVRTPQQTEFLFLCLIDIQTSASLFFRENQFEEFCLSYPNQNFSFSNYNHTFTVLNNNFQWNGTIDEMGIYIPYLIDCNSSTSLLYDINFSYSNPNSQESASEELIEKFSCIFAVIYFLIILFWITNTIEFSYFRVRLHTIWVSLPIFRFAMSLVRFDLFSPVFFSDYFPHSFQDPKQNNFESREIIIGVLNSFHDTMLLIGICLTCYGWCIFRNQIQTQTIVAFVMASSYFSLGFAVFRFAKSILTGFIGLAVTSAGIIWYIIIIVKGRILLQEISKKAKNPLIRAKIKLAKKSTDSCLFSIFTNVALTLFAVFMQASSFTLFLIQEICVMNSLIIHLKYFHLKQEYNGEKFNKEKLISIKEPTGFSIALITQG